MLELAQKIYKISIIYSYNKTN